MKQGLLIVSFVFIAFTLYGQKFSVVGQVVDTLSNPIASATAVILNPKDSSVISFSVSDAHGVFEIKDMNAGTYLLKITFVGLSLITRRISTPTNSTVVNVGRIKMRQVSKQLDEVIIKGDKAPVTVRRDTIEFNAESFKTKANATVEDLLKKLPGVEVDTDGNVSAQGEQVQRVLVDGKEFFGKDPKLATRNIPANAIDKVQVFDKKSAQAEFTGIEDGDREKTINIELKKDKRKGTFGKMMAGGGTNDRYQSNASLNSFDKGKQLSFLGMGNNINEQGFSTSDFQSFTGGQGGGSQSGVPINTGRQNGIMTNYAGGVNFNRDITPKTQIMSNYFYNHLGLNITRKTHRINYLPNDSSYFYDENSRQLSSADNHRINITADHKIDSVNSLRSTNNFSYSNSQQNSQTNGRTTLTDSMLQNTSNRLNSSLQTNYTLSSALLYRHRFAKKGRSFSTNLTLGLTQTNASGSLQSTNQYYNTNPGTQEIVQKNTQDSDNQSYGAVFTYIEPLGGRKYLEGTYSIKTNLNQVDREVFDEKNGQETINNQLTNKYNSIYVYSRPGMNLRFNMDKYNLSIGANYQNTSLNGDLISKGQKISKTFESVLPSFHFNYDFSKVKHLRMDYETIMQEPSIQQLQPVIDNSDPLNLSTGNPNLRPSYQHRLTSNFTAFNPDKFMNFFAFITASYVLNPVISSQTVNANLVRLTKPINVKDNVNLTGNFNFSLPVKKLFSRFSVGPALGYSQGINSLNEKLSNVWQQSLGGTARYNFTFKDFITVDLSANLSHQQTTYEFNTQNNQEYFNKTYSAETTISFLKRYQFYTDFDFLDYNSQTTNYSQTIPLWDIAISRFILKDNAGEFKIGVNNLLDRSLSVIQSASTNYLQQQVTNNLGRYFMVSFTYSLNKQLAPANNRRRGPRGPDGGGMRDGGIRRQRP